ncbi:TolC family protein [Candidatus Eisenbacteria bacterium]|uniref:TolC family protein n=1 Tax=Eiseniibacteriota bacterium TaxID=2212470 RepID=A0ABV6YMN7_UNCEI
MTKAIIPILICLMLSVTTAATAVAGVLDDYVEEGLEDNLALRQRDFSLEKSRAQLREARGLFFPTVDINARYSRAGGGRTVDFPVGDLINPIHDALNQLIGEPAFPGNLPNVSTPFLLEKEQETKLEILQPIFQPQIYYNYKINSNLVSVEEAGRDVFRQDLILEIKTAYYNYLKTVKFVELATETEALLQENLRISRSLFENQMVTREVVYRAQAELSELEQQKAEALKGRILAQSYFNFLLNRPLDTQVETEIPAELPPGPDADLAGLQNRALGKRYEVAQLERGIEAAGNGVRLSKSTYLPNLLFAFDYGYQGEDYRFGGEDDFWMGSLVLQWNLFSGLKRKAQTDQARAEENRLRAQMSELEQGIKLEVTEARQNLIVAHQAHEAALDRNESSAKSFEIVNRKFREGVSPQIEFLDARVTMTRAQVNLIVTTFDYHIRRARYERVVGIYSFNEDR